MSTVIDARKVSLAFQYAIGELDAEEALQIWQEMNALLGYYPLHVLRIQNVMKEWHNYFEGFPELPDIADELCREYSSDWNSHSDDWVCRNDEDVARRIAVEQVIYRIKWRAEEQGIALKEKDVFNPYAEK